MSSNSATTSEPHPGAHAADPARVIVVDLFRTLGWVCLGGTVLGWPFWGNPVLASAVLLSQSIAAWLAQRYAGRGRHLQAMHAFALVSFLTASVFAAFSSHLTGATLILMAPLAAYSAVCGRRYAVAMGGAYIAVTIALQVATRSGVVLPRLFPMPPAAEIAAAIIGMFGILGPLSVALDGLRRSLATLATDNLARRRIEEELRLFKTGVDQAMDGFAVAGLDSTFLYVNPTFARLHGRTVEEMIGQPVAIAHTPAQIAADVEPAFRQLADSGHFSAEVGHLRKDGTEFPTAMTASILRGLNGETLGYFSHMRDITERRRSDEERRASARLLQAEKDFTDRVLAASPDTVFVFDPLTRTAIRWNDVFRRVSGYGDEEIAALPVPDAYYSPEDLVKVAESLPRVLAGGHGRVELSLLTKDGRSIPFEYSAATVPDHEGRPRYVIATGRDVSERIRTEAELRKLSLAVEQSANSVIITDLDARIEYVNDAFVQHTGYTPDDVIGQNPRVLKSGRTPPAVYQEMWETLTRGERWRGELINRRKDGSDQIESATIVPLRQRDGRISHYVAVKEDITARREAEQRLTESEDRFRRLFEDTKEAITIVCDGVFVGANRASLDLLGVPTLDHLVGLTPADISPPVQPDGQPSAAKAQGMIARALAEGAHAFEWEHIRPNGQRFDADVLLTAITLGGRPHLHVVWRDITARKRTEEQVRQLSLAVEQSPESIVITNLAAEIEYVNQAFLHATGYTRDEVIGKNPRVLQSGRTPPETYREMWTTVVGGATWTGQFWNRRKDGSEYLESAIIAPIRQPDGRVTHYLAIKEDITERQRTAEELAAYRLNLEALVRSRTAELAEARERAEAASRAKSAFLANMSHEIRTPMNAIIGLSYLMQQEAPTPGQVDRLSKISASARHLLSLIDDILDLSKVEAGKLVLEERDCDPVETVHEVVEILRERADRKGLAVLERLPDDLPRALRGDPLRLRQILLNLGTNAVKFTEAGEVAIRATWVPAPADTHADSACTRVTLRFDVTDTGIGLTEEQRSRLFRPFEQADGSITRRYGGTGLGLAICKRLVDLMGGRIGVESVAGAGSTFWFSLPFAARDGVEPPAPGTAGSSGAAPPGATRALRILLVEDDPVNQEVAHDLLTAVGHRVTVAGNGARALELAAAAPFDLVVTDMQMPVMDGLATARVLRGMAGYATTPILAMTANAFSDDRERCLAAGMTDFIAKPVDPAAFYRLVAKWTAQPAASAGPGLPSTDASLEAIAGLDAAAGLARLQGRRHAYESLLRAFARDRLADVERVRQSLASGAIAEAVIVVHAIKGAAATLGATAIGLAAGRLEARLHATGASLLPVGDLDADVEALSQALAALKAAVAAWPEPEAPPAVPFDWADVRRIVTELDRLLGDYDIAAVDLFVANAGPLRAALGEVADDLGRYIESFDLTRARTLLGRVRAGDARLAASAGGDSPLPAKGN